MKSGIRLRSKHLLKKNRSNFKIDSFLHKCSYFRKILILTPLLLEIE